VLGLAIGADDYITKPFSIKELFARIEAVLRRSNRDAFPGSSNKRYFQDVEIDIDSHIVEKSGERIQLSPVEFSILSMLCDAKGKVVPRSLLIEKLLLSSGDAEARSLDVHIRNLRKKLGFSPNPYGYIETVRGIGLKINE
jgi:two-component system alkaline phosphatase synthesis response regulator PhoP